MIRSLKSQALLVLFGLIVILVTEVLIARSTTNTLRSNQQSIDISHELLTIAYELKHDVIDLQRHLLIFKETASSSTIAQFYSLTSAVEKKLNTLEGHIASNIDLNINKQTIINLRKHLADYKENFSSVIESQSQLQNIINKQIKVSFDILENYTKQQIRNKLQILYHLAAAENTISQYLVTPEIKLLKQLNNLTKTVNRLLPDNSQKKTLQAINSDFLNLTQITRSYLFLVNVVMAGSANEFLYSTNEIQKNIDEYINFKNLSNRELEERQQAFADIFSFVAILFALLSAWFLTHKLINPIRNLTDIFIDLSHGKETAEIQNKATRQRNWLSSKCSGYLSF